MLFMISQSIFTIGGFAIGAAAFLKIWVTYSIDSCLNSTQQYYLMINEYFHIGSAQTTQTGVQAVPAGAGS